MADSFTDDNDTNNPLPFPNPLRLGWDNYDGENPIATYYLRALNREIRALKSDYELACCCHTYIKLAVLSLRLYLPVWEGLLGEILEGDSGSDTEGEPGEERRGEGVYMDGLDGYRAVLETMDMPEQDIPPDRERFLPSNFWTARTYRSYCILNLSLAETMLHLISPGWRVARVVVEWMVVGLLTIVAQALEPSTKGVVSNKLAWTALMAVLGVACWSAVCSTIWLVSLQRCKREVRRTKQSVELNAMVKRDVEVLEGWWVRSWWWMSWLSVWVDELLFGHGQSGRSE